MTRDEFMRDYWAYYLMLEDRFIHTLNYVELSTDNKDAYSNEYAGLLQMIGAEMDSFFKVYCGYAPTDPKNISDYANYVISDFPGITSQEVSIKLADMIITPFDGWDATRAKKSLPWWLAFDNIKHSRTAHKKDSSQTNVLNALAALYILEMKQLNKITAVTTDVDIPDRESSIFELKGWNFRAIPLSGAFAITD